MSASGFKDLVRHVGHRVAVVTYGDPPENVAVECETCGEVLLDFNQGEEPGYVKAMRDVDVDLAVDRSADGDCALRPWPCLYCHAVFGSQVQRARHTLEKHPLRLDDGQRSELEAIVGGQGRSREDLEATADRVLGEMTKPTARDVVRDLLMMSWLKRRKLLDALGLLDVEAEKIETDAEVLRKAIAKAKAEGRLDELVEAVMAARGQGDQGQ